MGFIRAVNIEANEKFEAIFIARNVMLQSVVAVIKLW